MLISEIIKTRLADTYQALTKILIKKSVGFVYFLNKYILCSNVPLQADVK